MNLELKSLLRAMHTFPLSILGRLVPSFCAPLEDRPRAACRWGLVNQVQSPALLWVVDMRYGVVLCKNISETAYSEQEGSQKRMEWSERFWAISIGKAHFSMDYWRHSSYTQPSNKYKGIDSTHFLFRYRQEIGRALVVNPRCTC